MCRYLRLICALVALLAFDAFGNSSVKPRSKRAVHGHTPKLSFKDLALELAKKHLLRMIVDEQHDLQKAKESLYILQRDKCTNIKKIGKPVAHNTRNLPYGAWMKDPLEIMGAETIFVMEHYYGYVLEEYKNMNMFKAGLVHKKYKLPYYRDGTGAVVYGQHLYYNRASTNHIVKYNLKTERVEAHISVSSYYTRKRSYQWGGYSGMDLAVDEQGLWAIVGQSSSSYPLYLAKIDVVRNSIPLAWSLRSKTMNSLGNAFVACGVIYTIDNYSSRSTTITFAYDTKTGKQWNPNIQFTNQFGYNSMVDYNPREKVLYAWDNRRLVTYPITFEEQ